MLLRSFLWSRAVVGQGSGDGRRSARRSMQQHAGSSGAFGDGVSPRDSQIKHVIVILQENRSFDLYFGTYPGADGIPMQNGVPTVCVPDPQTRTCLKPYVDHADVNGGGPHSAVNATADVDAGKMDGFVGQQISLRERDAQTPPIRPVPTPSPRTSWGITPRATSPTIGRTQRISSSRTTCLSRTRRGACPPTCSLCPSGRRIARSTTTPRAAATPSRARVRHQTRTQSRRTHPRVDRARTDALTDLTTCSTGTRCRGGYYVVPGSEPDCENDASVRQRRRLKQNSKTPGTWNPLPFFDTVRNDGQLGSIQPSDNFYAQAKSGTLPAVSWVVPSGEVSEHPPSPVSFGQSYVTSLIMSTWRAPTGIRARSS